MIHRDLGTIAFVCDNCGAASDESDDFNEAKQLAEEAEWLFIKETSGDWEHYCKHCANC